MATRIIEGAAVRAATGREAPIAGHPAAVRVLIKLREHKARLMLLAVAAACVVAFASWLDDQLRPALEARERNELSEEAAQEMRAAVAPCVPSAGHSHTSWCGAVTIPPPPRPVTPLPLIAGAPAAFCTANGSPSC
ncbi:hypothetical protein M3I54_28815 [Paraburkholderia sp. CNPSo 3274]|uniref:hypothetical protein n=1 Tax=Paraburkholderia sp. CNPSo 3274 TaxID=2940932 RepID=UPI0020B69847|nr:hypothetical protein [Paraburkholderia sp. CNPSo 3274]MCP3710930.1 hypothetical protein [Paraburkholderia sp. CNPSo 3274]